MIDLAIIGGGPAGTAAALEARRQGINVTVWECERFPRDKVCGEFISSESVHLLELNIPELLETASVISRAEFISKTGNAGGFLLPAPARGLSRRTMDEGMWRAAGRAGADIRLHETVRRVTLLQKGGVWEVETADGSRETARSLLVACGRWWRIDGLNSPAHRDRNEVATPWLGAKAHFKSVRPRQAVEMFCFPGGYCGLAPVEKGLYNACCLVHRDIVRNSKVGAVADFAAWIKTISHHPALNERLRGATQEGSTVTTAPVYTGRRCATLGEVLFAGDASGFIDPFTGGGISMALQSGTLAGMELAKELRRDLPDLRSAARIYEGYLNESVGRSFVVAKLLRTLVRANAYVQHLGVRVISRLGPRLTEGTRWRADFVSERFYDSIRN